VTYREASWLDPRLEVRPSTIGGSGLFTCAPTAAGEPIVVWGGEVVDVWRKGGVAIGEGQYLAGPADDSDYINHSCDPTVWMRDEVTLVTRRTLIAGEEATADYILWESDEAWIAPWRCHCGTALCRGVVTGRDWRLPELRVRYVGHFSPFVEARIAPLQGVP
jgi:uncharacterized protein